MSTPGSVAFFQHRNGVGQQIAETVAPYRADHAAAVDSPSCSSFGVLAGVARILRPSPLVLLVNVDPADVRSSFIFAEVHPVIAGVYLRRNLPKSAEGLVASHNEKTG